MIIQSANRQFEKELSIMYIWNCYIEPDWILL